MTEALGTHPAWDSFWRYDRLSSFHASPGAPNYGPPIADAWRAFFRSLPDRARVLDLASGNGAIAVMAVESDNNLDVTAADLADVNPTEFVTRNRAELRKIKFLARTPVEALPLPPSSIDAVVSQFGVEYSDLSKSLPEAVRILAPGGRLRFAVHAREGAIVRDTAKSLADADFLLALNLPMLVAQASSEPDTFRGALTVIADRVPAAMDHSMLINVHDTLRETFDQRSAALGSTADHLEREIAAHRARQASLLDSALSAGQLDELVRNLETLGLSEVVLGNQSDHGGLVAHVVEATLAHR